MKNLKKTLSMVLVIVMMLGILVVGAGAAFTDEDDITYTTAVEVMTGIGAINGYADGTFKPLDSITRAEAAKMVAYAILTPRVAQMLPKTTSSFTDVAATNWASPFIEYCVSKGIINGMGDGTFVPAGNVTGYQIAKMMLCAVGYGKQDEYVGANWDLNVAIDAVDKGIFAGTLDTDLNDAATREEAALYVFNAMSGITQVVYDTTTNEYKDSAANATIGKQKYGLKFARSTVNGVDGYVWENGAGTALSTFVPLENVIGTSTNGTSIAQLTTFTAASTKYIATLATGAKYFLNGTEITVVTYAAGTEYPENTFILIDGELYQVKTGNTIETTDAAAAAKAKCEEINVSGAIVNLINTNADNKAEKVSIVLKSVGIVGVAPYVNPVTGAVTISGIGTFAKDTVTYPADLAAFDVVLFYTDGLGVTRIEKAATVKGQMTEFRTTSILFSGNVLSESGLTPGVLSAFNAVGNFNVDAAAYVDDNGDIISIKADAAAPITATYGVVIDYKYVAEDGTPGTLGYVPASAKVQLIKEDGTIGVYDVAASASTYVVPNQEPDFKNTAAPYADLCTYVFNDAGKVTVTAVGSITTATFTAANPLVVTATGNRYITSATKVFYYDASSVYATSKTASAATGYAGIKAATGKTIYYVLATGSTTNIAAILISDAPATTTVAGNYAYVINAGPAISYVGTTPIYKYSVYIDGVATTVTSKSDGLFAAPGLYAYEKDTDGYVTGTPEIKGAVTDGNVTLVESGYIAYVDGTTNKAVTTNADTKFYAVSAITGVTETPIAASTLYTTYAIKNIQMNATDTVATAIYFTITY